MYVYQRQVAAYRGIATLLTLALVLWAVGFHMFTQRAEAANLTEVSDTLSDSEPSGTSVHTIEFTTPTGMTTGDVFAITFPDEFDLSNLVNFADVTMTINGDATTTAAAAAADTWGVTIGTHHVEFETPTGDADVPADSDFIITIGSEIGNMIINPSAVASYEIDIGTDTATSTTADGGYAQVAIVDNVLVTAQIQTTFSFTVSGISNTGAAVNGTTTTGTTTNTTLPFGVLDANEIETLAQRLNVSTNAINGYIVTAEIDGQLESSTGADIDGFIDGAWTDDPTAWAAPTNNVSDEDTWGHWGLTSTDAVTGRAGGEFGSNEWIGVTTTPRIIMAHTGPADGVTDGVGSSTIGYQVEITALQEAGDDYNTTLTYIATPTF